jgi:hypothetical protein
VLVLRLIITFSPEVPPDLAITVITADFDPAGMSTDVPTA